MELTEVDWGQCSYELPPASVAFWARTETIPTGPVGIVFRFLVFLGLLEVSSKTEKPYCTQTRPIHTLFVSQLIGISR